MKTATVKRDHVILRPDPTRVLLRPFVKPEEPRAKRIVAEVLALTEMEVHALWVEVRAEFGGRHTRAPEFLNRRYAQVRAVFKQLNGDLSEERKMLLAAYFSHEYSLEAAALFNPSIVPHPDQSELSPGSLRFVLSLRATGEGHISSITFRTGVLDADNGITVNPATRFCMEPEHVPNMSYEKVTFGRKLDELGLTGDFSREVLSNLKGSFTLQELDDTVDRLVDAYAARNQESEATARKILMLAQSNYDVEFPEDSRVSERVLFPATPSQSNGIEDARFVQFHHEDGSTMYYATYTAYDGKMILPQFIETPDFRSFHFVTLNGPAVVNKGMALFPRKIDGHYVMLGRQDYENIYLMTSDHLHFWHATQVLLRPKLPWEFVQMGNCGSPIETEAGWLVLSHGVGPMRKYCIGAFLLDRDKPGKVLGRTREPLISPNEIEREGYVPNVVYSCGALVHKGQLVIPFAMSDYATTFATMSLEDVLAIME
jgi:predicted GH43/DUF377 family glycosyl hydrolase